MTDPISIIISILTGIASSLTLGALIYLIKTIGIPWYEDKIYQGVRIEGKWEGEFSLEGYGPVTPLFIIKQKGPRLTGTEITKFTSGETITVEQYDLEGYVFDGFVVLSSRNNDRTKMGYMTMLLRIRSRGDALDGSATWYDQVKHSIISQEKVLTRLRS